MKLYVIEGFYVFCVVLGVFDVFVYDIYVFVCFYVTFMFCDIYVYFYHVLCSHQSKKHQNSRF